MSERKQFGILQKVIYIADQSDVCHNICEYLDGEYQVIYKSISKALKTSQMLRNIYALYIIEMTNFTQTSETLINKIRQNSNSPIFFVSKANLLEKQKREAVYAFESGADDYITKPFSLMVLRARIRALLRRSPARNEPEYKDSIFLFRFETMEFYKNGISIELSKTEQRILYLLTSNPNIIITRERLLEWVWSEGTEYVEDNALSVAIRRLRDKLEDDSSNPQYIKTVYGKGYMWENL